MRFVVCTAASRALFLLIDPYWMRGWLSPSWVGLLYGFAYPAMNWALAKFTIGLLELSLWPSLKWRRYIGRALLVTAIAEFLTQIATDLLRGAGHGAAWPPTRGP